MIDEQRIRDLETDLGESEGRTMEVVADLKKELRQVAKRQDLHTEILIRLLTQRPIFTPESELLIKKLKGSSCDCSHQ